MASPLCMCLSHSPNVLWEILLLSHSTGPQQILVEMPQNNLWSVWRRGENSYKPGSMICSSGVASSISEGDIFIYSYFAQLISFEICCFYGLWTWIHEYVPPTYRLSPLICRKCINTADAWPLCNASYPSYIGPVKR